MVGVCYRPPNEGHYFDTLENNLLSSDKTVDQETILMGDFNVHYSNKNNSSLMRTMKRFMSNFDLDQLIDQPTRVTPETSTILDLIFTSNCSKISNSGVIDCGISDHAITFCTRKVSKDFFGKHNTVKLRSIKNYDVNVFISKLNKVNWFDVINCEIVNDAWTIFKSKFMSVLDEVAPVKQVRLKQKSELWFNSEILNAISQRDSAYKSFLKTKSQEDHKVYASLRNLTQKKIKLAKQTYVKDHIESNSSSIKKLWSSLKNLGLMGKVKSQNVNICLKNDKNEVIFDKSFVVNKFNQFFCNVAQKLVDKLPSNTKIDIETIRNYYSKKNVVSDQFKFTKVSESEVLKMLKDINVNKATGMDNIGAKFLKDSANVIVEPITYLLNLSFENCMFPDDFKNA